MVSPEEKKKLLEEMTGLVDMEVILKELRMETRQTIFLLEPMSHQDISIMPRSEPVSLMKTKP